MAVRQIRYSGDMILRKNCKLVDRFDEKLHQLLDDMNDTMRKFEGVGLAAPQIGILRRVVIVDVGQGLVELINPEIILKEGIQDGPEGCLSCPGIKGRVERPQRVEVVAYDRNKNQIKIKAEGMFARAICHEVDHINGILFKDIAKEVVRNEEE